ncbi:amino acid ABC transporter permease [Microlunatus panaciterrae]|uniref:Glutamate transport system permease protein n=1 Tax=Microlunatus panaciterrae TaxID=400768 RepID=A0ABS2RNK3_9ACTN|nr:amino acid ABC transporter permease [Microlunatus panaciterrae]MBM7800589.1 glutamate transport system permease protein [Microlunatus panaciterrae]
MSAQTSVLFDVPGPRAKRRHVVLGVIGVLALAGVLLFVLRALANPENNQLTAEKWLPFISAEAWTAYFLPGLRATVTAAAIAVVLSSIFGILLGMGRLSGLAPVRWVCGIFVEFFRSVPVLMMMLFSYYFALYALQMTGDVLSLFGVVAGLTFYNSCVIAELIRSGVNSLPKGQGEAGLAIGLTPTQTLTSILLPQAITAMLPSIISQLVVILKDSALGYIISYSELIRAGQNFASSKGNLIPTFIVLAVLFIVMNYALTRLARLLEGRMQARRRGGGPAGSAPDPQLQVGAATTLIARDGGNA